MRKKNLIKEYDRYYQSFKAKKFIPLRISSKNFYASSRNKKLFQFCNYKNKKLLDLSFGDGRNLNFFHSLGFKVYGTEISKKL